MAGQIIPDFAEFVSRTATINAAADHVRGKPGAASHCESTSFYVEGTKVAATLWLPSSATAAPPGKQYPALLLCHGWGGLRAHLDVRYGRLFSASGFVVLTFDYRGWGDSDGVLVPASSAGAKFALTDLQTRARSKAYASSNDPSTGPPAPRAALYMQVVRNTVNMDWQRADIDAAMAYLASHPRVDDDRVGIWGTSQGGGHVLGYAGSRVGRATVAAVVAQAPSCGVFGAGELRGRQDQSRQAAAAAARAPEASLSIPQGIRDLHLPALDGVPILPSLTNYDPLATAHRVAAPTLVIDAADEEIFDRAENGAKAVALINGDKGKDVAAYELVPGRHYDVYDAQHKVASGLALRFFERHLGGGGGGEGSDKSRL